MKVTLRGKHLLIITDVPGQSQTDAHHLLGHPPHCPAVPGQISITSRVFMIAYGQMLCVLLTLLIISEKKNGTLNLQHLLFETQNILNHIPLSVIHQTKEMDVRTTSVNLNMHIRA